jgi:hypothetical protein
VERRSVEQMSNAELMATVLDGLGPEDFARALHRAEELARTDGTAVKGSMIIEAVLEDTAAGCAGPGNR